MLVEGWKVSVNMSLYASVCNWIGEIPDHLKTVEICAEAEPIKTYSLEFVHGHFKTQEERAKALRMQSLPLELEPYILAYVPNQRKAQELCNKPMHIIPTLFFLASGCFKI